MVVLQLKKVCINDKECRYVPYNTSNKKMHWAKKAKWKKAWEEEVGWCIYENRKKLGKLPYQKAHVTVVFTHIQLFDKDGSYTAAKPIIDGLTKNGVIIDDSPKYIDLHVEQRKAIKVSDQNTQIRIYDTRMENPS